MEPPLLQRLARLESRLAELDAVLADASVGADPARWRGLAREQAEVAGVVESWRRYRALEADEAAAAALAADAATDAELRALAAEEVQALGREKAALHERLLEGLVPRDPDDARNAFLEIRAGTGGDESALFAGDLARMYLRWCERAGLRTEVVSQSASDLGGWRELVLRVEGAGAFGRLRWESGGHRVQRVPQTESQGRIHTSACTVAVLAEPDEAEALTLNPAELRIDTFRASGAGGQHVNKTDSAIRITHLPTGLVAECQDDRSQHRNKARALAVLQARLREKERSERAAKEAATRKSLVGSGDRSDRIRTYNFPQGRVTDHRIGFTLHKLAAVMEGELDELLAALARARAAEQLEALHQGAAPP
jgi:peptide chain release factor 1